MNVDLFCVKAVLDQLGLVAAIQEIAEMSDDKRRVGIVGLGKMGSAIGRRILQTGAEVAVYYVKSLTGVLVPILLLMSAVKFGTVVLWFMHLRFDSQIFRRLFLLGLSLATAVYLIVLSIFGIFR